MVAGFLLDISILRDVAPILVGELTSFLSVLADLIKFKFPKCHIRLVLLFESNDVLAAISVDDEVDIVDLESAFFRFFIRIFFQREPPLWQFIVLRRPLFRVWSLGVRLDI